MEFEETDLRSTQVIVTITWHMTMRELSLTARQSLYSKSSKSVALNNVCLKKWYQHSWTILTEMPHLAFSLGISSSLELQKQEFVTPEDVALNLIHTSDPSIWKKKSAHTPCQGCGESKCRVKDGLTLGSIKDQTVTVGHRGPSGRDNLQHWQPQKAVTALVHIPRSLRVDCTKTPDTRKPARSRPALGYRQGRVGLK